MIKKPTLQNQLEELMFESIHHKKDVLNDKYTMGIIKESISQTINNTITRKIFTGDTNG